MPSPRLPVAALLAVALAALGDEAVRSDASRITGCLTLSDAGRFQFGDESVAGLDRVRFTPKAPPTPPVPLWHQVHLAHGQLVLAEVRELSDQGLDVRTTWADSLMIPRTAVERVTHLPGWRPVLVEPFDSLAAWTTAGEPKADRGRLMFDRAGQSVEIQLKSPPSARRVGVTFRSAVTAGQRASLELGFVRDGKPNVVRVELVGPDGQYAVTAADRPDHIGTLGRDAAPRRLTVEFDRDRLAVFVDELVLWVRNAGPGELRSIKFTSEGDGTESATIDDVSLLVPESITDPRPWADLTADAVRSPAGDETFGTLTAAGPGGVTLEIKGKRLALGWPEAAEFTFRRGTIPEQPTRGEHVRVRLRTAEGLYDLLDGVVKAFDARGLVLVHPVLGELRFPRDRIEEVQLQFHGRRVPVDSSPHHLGARPAFGFAVPKPEGLRFARTFPLEKPAAGFVVVEAAQVSGTGTQVEVLVNGELVGELNRLAGRARPEVRAYRLPVTADLLRRGDNEVEVRLRPAAGGRVTGIDVRAVRLELTDPR